MRIIQIAFQIFSIVLLISCTSKRKEAIYLKRVISNHQEVSIDFNTPKSTARDLFSKLKNKNKAVHALKDDYYRIDIGKLMGNETTFALLAYFTSDTTAKVLISENSNKGWIDVFDTELSIYQGMNDFSFLRFEDFTGDGIKEILIPQSIASSHENFTYYCLHYSAGRFELIPGFEDLTHPEFDSQSRTIHTLHGGGYGNYIANEYKLRNNKLVEIREFSSRLAPSSKSKDGFVQIIENYAVKSGNRELVKTDSIHKFSSELPYFWAKFYENK